MIQTLWFFLQIAVVIGAALWLLAREGSVSIELMDYTLTMQVGIFLLLLVGVLLVSLFAFRIVRSFFSIPKTLAVYREKDKRKKGYRALTRGLVAVAAGDAKRATQFAKQTKSLMGDQGGLPVLLEAQAARLRGEEGLAQNHFEKLLEDKDAAFLGIRGLLRAALDEGDVALALEYARRAQNLHPKQGWVLKMVYDLEIQNHLWSEALETGKKAVKSGALEQNKAVSDRIAIYLMRFDYELEKGDSQLALKDLKRAYKLDNSFVPTVTRLAAYYIDRKKNRKAASIIETSWCKNPHPELAVLWDRLAPKDNGKNASKRLKWYEKLVSFKSDSAEGQMAAARAAIDMSYWGEAKAYLMMAERIHPTARLFALLAKVEQNSTHNEEAIHQLMAKASEALPDKVWTCSETGGVYEEWSAIALPHESFNTIVWDYPQARVMDAALSNPQTSLLIGSTI